MVAAQHTLFAPFAPETADRIAVSSSQGVCFCAFFRKNYGPCSSMQILWIVSTLFFFFEFQLKAKKTNVGNFVQHLLR